MLCYTYDCSFEGLLTCVFDSFYRTEVPLRIQAGEDVIPLFWENFNVITDPKKADRVITGLKKLLSPSALRMLFVCFLSESSRTDWMIFNYIRKTFQAKASIELNFADRDVLELSKIYKKVGREAERMRQFIRFQKTKDDIFFAYIEPLYNVLPLTVDFFEDRFADQQWIIYDAKREYGYYYNLEKTEEVRFNQFVLPSSGKLAPEQLDADELDFRQLWKDYLQSVTIKERVNLKLQRQFMPKRFWKHLTEKQ
jgi:probable DNA metabolism protein